jgi:hypothetical protein
MPIHIQSEDEEVLAKLRELGIDAQVVSDDPIADSLFYLARMNAKLDNLGQLRHLHKMMQTMLRIRAAAEAEHEYYSTLNKEHNLQLLRLKRLYNELKSITNHPENEPWRQFLPPFDLISPKTEEAVLRAFQCRMDGSYRIVAVEDDFVYVAGILEGTVRALGTDASKGSLRLLGQY